MCLFCLFELKSNFENTMNFHHGCDLNRARNSQTPPSVLGANGLTVV